MRVTVMGLGLFGGGVGAARHFAVRGDRVTVTDLKDATTLAPSIDRLEDLPQIRFVLGRHDEDDFVQTDLVVANPAVPDDDPYLTAARSAGVPIETEMGLFLGLCKARVVAVTGSNGKSTTTRLLHAILAAAGIRAKLGGNIGISLLPEVGRLRDDDLVVLELSSFQLERLSKPHRALVGGIITNVLPNHLDRHGTFEAYAAAKGRLIDLLDEGAVLVIDGDDAASCALAAGRSSRDVRMVTTRDVLSSTVRPARLRGGFNVKNLLMAATLARSVDPRVTDAIVGGVAATFPGIEHRLEVFGIAEGITFVNDSKATTPEAAAVAVGAFAEPLHLILGGYDKHLELAPLIRAASKARTRHLVGQTASQLASAFAAVGVPFVRYERFDDAVDGALAAARSGDVVLLSPGFPSWGLFNDYRERGRSFKARVASSRTHFDPLPRALEETEGA